MSVQGALLTRHGDILTLGVGGEQVFDKALMEPTFSETYAALCSDLDKSLPTFEVKAADGQTAKACTALPGILHHQACFEC